MTAKPTEVEALARDGPSENPAPTHTEEEDRVRRGFRELDPTGFLTLDEDGRILSANQRACLLLGRGRAQLTGSYLSDWIVPDSRAGVATHLRTSRERREVQTCEARVPTSGSEPRIVQLDSLAVDVAETGSPGFRTSLIDVSRRVRAEEDLLEINERLEALVAQRTSELFESRRLAAKIAEAAPAALWIFSLRKRRAVYLNAYARSILGCAAEVDSLEVPILERIDPGDRRVLTGVIRDLKNREDQIGEATIRVRDASGVERRLACRITAFDMEDGKVVSCMGSSTDLTREIQFQERTRQLAQDAAIAGERERRELGMLLHDSIGQLLPLASTKLGLLGASLEEGLKERLGEINRLVVEAHRTATSLTYRLSPPALHEIGLTAGLTGLGREMRREYGLEVEVVGDRVFPVRGAIEYTLFRVVNELLVNVAKHSQQSRAEVRIGVQGSTLEVEVRDEGVGFDRSAIRDGAMGLASASERIEYLGGTMTVSSSPGSGTCVRIRAPFEAYRKNRRVER